VLDDSAFLKLFGFSCWRTWLALSKIEALVLRGRAANMQPLFMHPSPIKKRGGSIAIIFSASLRTVKPLECDNVNTGLAASRKSNYLQRTEQPLLEMHSIKLDMIQLPARNSKAERCA
jgi:hypothetical protein